MRVVGRPPQTAVMAVLVTVLASSLWGSAASAADRRRDTKDQTAVRAEHNALRVFAGGNTEFASWLLRDALVKCEGTDGCSAKTKAHLHVSLGTVSGAGRSDYASAKKEFAAALALDPDVRPDRTLAPAPVMAAFDSARAEATPSAPPPVAPSDPVPTTPGTISELFHPESAPPRPAPLSTADVPPPPAPESPSPPEPLLNWFSLRAVLDVSYLGDANVCSRGAPANYFCNDEKGARYVGRPQPNDAISRGFATSTTRIVLGYERLLFRRLALGALVGYAFGLAPRPAGGTAVFPLHLEGRITYAFGTDPYLTEKGSVLAPYLFLAAGAAEIDTHVLVRVNEIPCGSKVAPACHRDLDAYRRSGGVFTTIGGGVRYGFGGRQALRAAVKASVWLGDGVFAFSPELTYEVGL